MWVLALAAAVITAIGGFWALLAAGRAGRATIDPKTNLLTLRHGRLFRVIAIVTFVGMELLIGSVALLFPPRTAVATGLFVAVAVVVALLGIILIWDAYRFGLGMSPTHLHCHSPWRGSRTIAWSEIERISFSSVNLWFAIEPKSGPAFHVLGLVPGVNQFLEACETHLPHEKLRLAEPGYAWVLRRFPGDLRHREPPPLAWKRWTIRIVSLAGVLVLLFAGAFAFNGLILARGDQVEIRYVVSPRPERGTLQPRSVTVITFNIGGAQAHRGGFDFAPVEEVTGRLERIATIIRTHHPDIVCLQNVLTEAGSMPVDQLEFLAKATGLEHVAFGELSNVGVPGYRVVSGNAILSRFPLTAETNLALGERRSFTATRNHGRALLASVELFGSELLIGSVLCDPADPANNETQMRQLLDHLGPRPCLLAGSFNAAPDQPALSALRTSGRFTGQFDGPKTFPTSAPVQRLDYVVAPSTWDLLDTVVVTSPVSDHAPVASIFTVPINAGGAR